MQNQKQNYFGKHGDLMVSALVSRLRGPGLSQANFVVFLGKALNSYSAG